MFKIFAAGILHSARLTLLAFADNAGILHESVVTSDVLLKLIVCFGKGRPADVVDQA